MKLGIKQPYFFPYLGYWQLINAVDKFVLLDDVNFIMRGYINRNSILVNGKAHLFTIPLEKPSQNKLINETKLRFNEKEKENFLKTLTLAYKKAPFYNAVFPIMQDIINNKENDLTLFLKYSFEKAKDYLNIDSDILLSSEIKKDNSLHAQDRIIAINKTLGADLYINAIGGQKLYDRESFRRENIELKFIKMHEIKYTQFKNDFVPNLSMIDIMMFNSPKKIKEKLNDYELI